MKNTTKIIASAGLFTAMYAAVFLVSLYTGGQLESTLFFLLPLPMCLFTFKYGIKYALIPYFATAIIGYFINPINTIAYVLAATLLGTLYGELLRKNTKSFIRLIVCVLITFIVNICTMLIFAKFLGYSINDEISKIFRIILEILKVDFLEENIFNQVVVYSIPLFILISSLIEGFLIHLLCCMVMNKLKLTNVSIGNIYLYSLPKWSGIVWIFSILFHFLTLNQLYNETGFIHYIAIGLFELCYLMIFIFFIQGIVTTFLGLPLKTKHPKLIAIIITLCVIFLLLPSMIVLSIIGIIYVFSDYPKHLLYNNK